MEELISNFVVEVIDNIENVAEDSPRRRRTFPIDVFRLRDVEVKKNFRLDKNLIRYLMELIAPVIVDTSKLDLQTKVLCTLHFLATGSYQTPTGNLNLINISQPSTSRCLSDVVEALNHPSIFNEWVRFPRNLQEFNVIARDFYRLYGFPGVIGCIDCTHVAIVTPTSPSFEESVYVNSEMLLFWIMEHLNKRRVIGSPVESLLLKGYFITNIVSHGNAEGRHEMLLFWIMEHLNKRRVIGSPVESLLLKGYFITNIVSHGNAEICDSRLRILNVNALFPGSTHDSYIWSNSAVLPTLQNMHTAGCNSYHLLGDSGYPLRPWCLTPILDTEEGSPAFLYNEALKKTRSIIERCNGVLKGRFRCLLKDRVLHYSPIKATKIINACCVLHNICVAHNFDEPDDMPDYADLGFIDLPSPSSSSRSDRGNIFLLQGREKQQQIINNYFT